MQTGPLTEVLGDRAGSSKRGGVQIMSVEPGGAAERAGLEEGDVIIGLDEHPVGGIDDRVGVKLPLCVLRRPEILIFTITPEESKPSAQE